MDELGEHDRLVAARAGAAEAQVPVPEVALGAAALTEVSLLARRALVHAGGGELRTPPELDGQRSDIDRVDVVMVAKAVRAHPTRT
jgi:hypothetical protein